ncbi:hypothetical protein HG530_014570 [Fusarium avenaceum]|nr:hypothetical protein HG530_014570 [Fusarium avenaceum]
MFRLIFQRSFKIMQMNRRRSTLDAPVGMDAYLECMRVACVANHERDVQAVVVRHALLCFIKLRLEITQHRTLHIFQLTLQNCYPLVPFREFGGLAAGFTLKISDGAGGLVITWVLGGAGSKSVRLRAKAGSLRDSSAAFTKWRIVVERDPFVVVQFGSQSASFVGEFDGRIWFK